jgi:hypothetical protein
MISSGGRDGGVELAQGGDEGCVNVLRSDLAPAELEVWGGAGVGNERHLEAEVGAGSRGRVDAHARHHPRHDDLVDVEAVQVLLEVGAQERVGRALGDERLAVLRRDRRHDLCTVGSFLKKSDSGRAEVLDVDDRVAGGAERLEDLAGLGGRGLRLVQRHVPAGEVVALDVDDDEGFTHEPHGSAVLDDPRYGRVEGYRPRGFV